MCLCASLLFFEIQNLFYDIEAFLIFYRKEGKVNFITFETVTYFLYCKMDFLTVVAVAAVQYS